jgi:hypothetical protein
MMPKFGERENPRESRTFPRFHDTGGAPIAKSSYPLALDSASRNGDRLR